MSILLTTSTFPLTRDDGRPRFILDLAQAMADAGATVTVLAPGAADAPPQEQMGGVEVLRFSYFRPRRWQRLAYGPAMRETIRASPLTGIQVPCYVLAQTAAVLRLVRGPRQIQVVNSHWLVPQGLSGAIAKALCPRIRHVVHAHAADVYLLRKLPGGRRLARWIVAHADAVFAAGSHVRQTLDELLGHPSGALLRPMGASRLLFATNAPAPQLPVLFPEGYLLFFGRLVEKKGVTHLLRAMPHILLSRPGLGLVVIGSGPLEAPLRQEAQDLGVAQSVQFLGQQPQARIAQYLHGCRAAVVPSVIDSRGETEGMPTVILEAMAAGARVVGSAVAGIPDVIRHGENGWLCRPSDAQDLAAAILLALQDPDGSPIRQAALTTAHQFDWPEVARSYLGVLRPASVSP